MRDTDIYYSTNKAIAKAKLEALIKLQFEANTKDLDTTLIAIEIKKEFNDILWYTALENGTTDIYDEMMED